MNHITSYFCFVVFWLRWVFVDARGLSLVAASGGSGLWCSGFSLQWLLLLWSMGSRHAGFSSCGTQAQQLQHVGPRVHRLQQLWCVGSTVVTCRLSSCGLRALELRLSSCGARAQLLCGLWDLPQPVIEPVSPALAGGFLTTAPRGKSAFRAFYLSCLLKCFSFSLLLLSLD